MNRVRAPLITAFSTAFFFAAVFFSRPAPAADFHSLETASFRTSKSEPARISALDINTDPRPILLLFWANWCVPCKAELDAISKNPTAWKEFRPVAVNTDEIQEQSSADNTLNSMGWPFERWFDDDGKVFSSVQESGELPLALLFSKGRFVEKFSAMSEAQIEAMKKLLAQEAASESSFRVSESFQFRTLNNGSNPDAIVLANVVGVGWDSRNTSAQLEGYSIRQKRTGQVRYQPWENEFGRSYIRHKNFTLGDQSLHLHQGMILSVRALSASDQNSSLLGGSFSLKRETDEFQIYGGKIRDLLYAFQLDPSQDLTRDSPTEIAAGVHYEKQFNPKLKSGFEFATYRRSESTALGYPAEKRDLRFGIPFRLREEKVEVDLLPTHYRDLEKRKSAWAGETIITIKPSPVISVPLYFQQTRQDFPRVYFSTPLDAPALPLSVDRRRSTSGALRALRGKSELQFRLTRESGFDANAGDKQDSLSLSALSTEGVWKSHFVHQSRDLHSVNSKTHETFLDGTWNLHEAWVLGVSAKRHSTSARSLDLQGGVNLKSLFDASHLKELQVSVSLTEQRGAYYYGFSGIPSSRLVSAQIRTAFDHYNASIAFGKQSGGLQCSGGVCAQVPPLNGWRGVLATAWSF